MVNLKENDMGREIKGRMIRKMRVDEVGATVPVPSTLKHLFADGYDACMIVQIKRHLIRANLSVSSGQELGIPEWLKKTILSLAKEQKVEVVSFHLSARPIWLVRGEQDTALKAIWSWQKDETAWGSLSEEQRREVSLRWIIEQLATTERDALKQTLHAVGL